jgi:2-polyprenyl-3-methyl-5-hydroxy-6-metoxy-1,4-benzoquinol methylase
VRPAELTAAVARSGLRLRSLTGMRYNPWRHTAAWCKDPRVNYIAEYETDLIKAG